MSTRGLVLLDAPWRWLVDSVGPEDQLEFAVTSSLVKQDPAYSPWPTIGLLHHTPEYSSFLLALLCFLAGLVLEQSPC